MDSSSSTSMKITEGTIPFVVDGETYYTWFKAFGDLSSDRPQTITPLIALHGGPGLSHDYMTPITDITTTDSIPVILYDQLGSGRSTHLRDKPPSFWNIDLFINELENLISYLKLTSFDIIGHSWGGMLGLEFAIRRQPPGLRRLVLASAHPDMALWNQSNMQLMKGMDEDVQQGLMKGFADPQGYRAALDKFHAVHGCRIQPFPKEFVTSLEMIFGENGDPTVSMAMFSGELKAWSVVDRLHEIREPTLVINGRYDVSQDFVCEPFFRHIPKVKWITFEKSSHSAQFEERERYMQVLVSFLRTQ